MTTFAHGLDAYDPTVHVTDALGGTRAWSTDRNAQLNRYTSVSWDERAWAAGPGSIATATRTRWLLWAWSPCSTVEAVSVPH